MPTRGNRGRLGAVYLGKHPAGNRGQCSAKPRHGAGKGAAGNAVVARERAGQRGVHGAATRLRASVTTALFAWSFEVHKVFLQAFLGDATQANKRMRRTYVYRIDLGFPFPLRYRAEFT